MVRTIKRLLVSFLVYYITFAIVTAITWPLFDTLFSTEFYCGVMFPNSGEPCSKTDFFFERLTWAFFTLPFLPLLIPELVSDITANPFQLLTLSFALATAIAFVLATWCFRLSRRWI